LLSVVLFFFFLVSSLLLCLFNLGPFSRVHADSIGDTSHQGSISRFRQSIALETSSHPLLLNRQSVVTILSLWELNNFYCSCFHGSISVDTLQYICYVIFCDYEDMNVLCKMGGSVKSTCPSETVVRNYLITDV
jgi:hypothetical protein